MGKSETSLGIYDTINELSKDLEGKLTYVKDVNNIYLNKNDDDTLGWYKIKTVGDVLLHQL